MGCLDAISLKKNEIQKERGNVEPFVKIGLEIQLIRTLDRLIQNKDSCI